MSQGIILFGASGSGTTTLGKEIAKRLCYQHFDIDDYHWRWDTNIPYTVFRPNEERIKHLMNDLSNHPNFVMSGSMWSIRKSFEHLFDLAVFVTTSAEIRAERLRTRNHSRWGDRVLPGGDMYEANEIHKGYFAHTIYYDADESVNSYRKQHEQWAVELPCPVLRIEGSLGISENVPFIIERFYEIL